MSLVEGLVVVAVVGLSVLVALPAMRASQIFARRALCVNHLKQIGLAAHNYEATWGAFPMSRVAGGEGRGVGHSAHMALLPFLEQVAVYNAYNFDLEPHDVTNGTSVGAKLAVLLCPDNRAGDVVEPLKAEDLPTPDGKGLPGENLFGRAHYGFNWGGGREGFGDDFVKAERTYRGLVVPVLTPEGKALGVTRNIKVSDVVDGLSFTLLAAERRSGGGWAYGGPGGSEYDVHTSSDYNGDLPNARAFLTGAAHADGPNVLFGDGSVRPIAPKVERKVWYALQTRDGGEAIRQADLMP